MAKLYFSTTNKAIRKFSAKARKSELLKVHRGIYTNALYSDLEKAVNAK